METEKLETIENLPQVDIDQSGEDSQITLIERVEDGFDQMTDQSLVRQWISSVTPYLQPGGRPVALILALGIVSIPLLISGNAWVALILATGASAVAIRSSWLG